MLPRLPTGILFAVLFTIAMGMHLVLTDRGLQEHYPVNGQLDLPAGGQKFSPLVARCFSPTAAR